MGLLEFLEAVVPSGHLVSARKVDRTSAEGRDYTTFQHGVSKSHDDFAAALVKHALTKKDTYFALAAYKQGFHEAQKGGKTKKVLRVRENVDTLKALWLDVDFKDGYATGAEVGQALKAFCQASGYPAPSLLVHSGNGIHAYWPFAEPVPLDEWQALADALKAAAKEHGLRADLACTADACRVLRPPGTVNWKDPDNPKRVKVLYSSGKLFGTHDLTVSVTGDAGQWYEGSQQAGQEFTGGVGSRGKSEPSLFSEVIKHCAVSRQLAENQGKESSEPEWVAMLQLLKYCTDAELWVHEVSKGHPGYDAQSTNEKWQHRLDNDAGPTLCGTFEGYYPELCKNCPHHGFIKTPLQVGAEGVKEVAGMPKTFRCKNGVTERLMKDENDQFIWVKAISYQFANFRTARSTMTGLVEHRIDVPGVVKDVAIPGEFLGNQNKLVEHMASVGIAFKGKEAVAFKELMTTWLKQLQDAKREADVTEQLGWMVKDNETLGFSCGQTTFYADGRVRNDVRAAREFQAVAKHYEPQGELDRWKEVAAFLADQNNPAFTALLASAFAAPILRFTGVSGAIMSIVSSESGVGKTSALKCAQSVWGSPTHGVSAIEDTPLSVARKIGFLNNLPAYWDELRGEGMMEKFLTLAFQVTQGKEKTRLDQSSAMRAIHTWETMLIVASNDSIFDAMGRYSIGSDAGVARTFEITVEPFKSEASRAKVAVLFETLHTNYGLAGKVYAQHIATHREAVAVRVQIMRAKLGESQEERGAERFWFSTMASLIVGAQLASELGLVTIDTKTLAGFLIRNLVSLRGRSVESMTSSEPREILATYMQQHQDKILVVDRFPVPRSNMKNYMPQIVATPRTDKLICHQARDENLVRFSKSDFTRWATTRGMNSSSVFRKLRDELGATEIKSLLGIGTKYEIPSRQVLVQIPITGSSIDLEELVDGRP